MKNMKETRKRIPLIALVAVVCVVGLAITATTNGSAFADIFSPNDSERGTSPSSSASTENDNSTAYIGTERAKTIVLEKIPGATITNIYFEYDEGRAEYDGEGYLDNEVYDFTVDALSGEIVEWEVDVKNATKTASSDAVSSATKVAANTITTVQSDVTASDAVSSATKSTNNSTPTVQSNGTALYIGLDAAKTIALNRVSGATITELYLEHDDGRVEYEGEMYLNNTEYEFTIDAVTGRVLEWETEYEDDDDEDDDDEDDDDEDDDDEIDD